jgi:hypothetical protein
LHEWIDGSHHPTQGSNGQLRRDLTISLISQLNGIDKFNNLKGERRE